jgi:hypothetical protein
LISERAIAAVLRAVKARAAEATKSFLDITTP